MDSLGNLFGNFQWDSVWSIGGVGPEPKTETKDEEQSHHPNGDNPAMHSAVTGFGGQHGHFTFEEHARAEQGASQDGDGSASARSDTFGMHPSTRYEHAHEEALISQLEALESYRDPDEEEAERPAAVSKVMASKADMKRLKEMRAENAKLQQLRDKYQIRVADAEKNREDARTKVKKVPPAILRKGQLWTCEGVVDEAVEVDMSERKRSQEGELRISKCYTTGMFWSRTASVRVVGRARTAVIEDCHKLLLTLDGVEQNLIIRRCSELTLALASEMPTINMMRVRDSNLILCYSSQSQRTVQSCMCTDITLNLLEGETLFLSVEVLNAWPSARRLQLPDVVQVSCKGQTLQCSAQTANAIDDSSLTLSLDCIEDFQPIRSRLQDKDTDQVERNLCLPTEQTRPRQVVNMGEVGTLKHISAAFLKHDPFFHTRKNLL